MTKEEKALKAKERRLKLKEFARLKISQRNYMNVDKKREFLSLRKQ